MTTGTMTHAEWMEAEQRADEAHVDALEALNDAQNELDEAKLELAEALDRVARAKRAAKQLTSFAERLSVDLDAIRESEPEEIE